MPRIVLPYNLSDVHSWLGVTKDLAGPHLHHTTVGPEPRRKACTGWAYHVPRPSPFSGLCDGFCDTLFKILMLSRLCWPFLLWIVVAPGTAEAQPASFDYYLLSLSYAPDFCAQGSGYKEPRNAARDVALPSWCMDCGRSPTPGAAPPIARQPSL